MIHYTVPATRDPLDLFERFSTSQPFHLCTPELQLNRVLISRSERAQRMVSPKRLHSTREARAAKSTSPRVKASKVPKDPIATAKEKLSKLSPELRAMLLAQLTKATPANPE